MAVVKNRTVHDHFAHLDNVGSVTPEEFVKRCKTLKEANEAKPQTETVENIDNNVVLWQGIWSGIMNWNWFYK